MADFSTFDVAAQADEGADMQLYFPNGDPVAGCIIRVKGFESRELRDMARDFERKAMKGQAVDTEKQGMALLVAATKSWSGIEWEGKPMACTPSNIEKLYRAHDWIARQVTAFASKPAHFFTPPPGV
jgi:hypothetical protein